MEIVRSLTTSDETRDVRQTKTPKFEQLGKAAQTWKDFGTAVLALVNQAAQLGSPDTGTGFLPEGARTLTHTDFGNGVLKTGPEEGSLSVGEVEALACALFVIKTRRGGPVAYPDLQRAALIAKADGFGGNFRSADYFVGKFPAPNSAR